MLRRVGARLAVNVKRFDYIVVGGGSAGCVLASRLSRKGPTLLLEAGASDWSPVWRVPLLSIMYGVLLSKKYNWRYFSAPEEHLNGRRIYQPRGKVLGGSGTINGMIWVRGHPKDYDRWAQITGDESWRYDSFKAYLAKIENSEVDGENRGKDGKMQVSRLAWRHPLSTTFLQASEQFGVPIVHDFHHDSNTRGVGFYEMTQRGGARVSTRRAYLADSPAAAEAEVAGNLTTRCNATVDRVLLEGGRAVGVQWNGGEIAFADGEVVLAAGVFGSPHVLMLSGIGPPDHLAAYGIECRVPSPGVGGNLMELLGEAVREYGLEDVLGHDLEQVSVQTLPEDDVHLDIAEGMEGQDNDLKRHLVEQIIMKIIADTWNHQDHLDVGVQFENPSKESLGLSPWTMPLLASAPWSYLWGGGVLTSNGVDAGGYIMSEGAEDGYQDLQLHFFPGSFRDYKVHGLFGHYMALNVYLSRPFSSGTARLRSACPRDSLHLNFNFLDDDRDRKALVSGVRQARRIMQQRAFDCKRGAEVGSLGDTCEQILEFIKVNAKSAHHPVGTCRMGTSSDPMAVVDGALRVNGVDGLRVADASVFPTHTTSNPYQSVIALAEKCAEAITL